MKRNRYYGLLAVLAASCLVSAVCCRETVSGLQYAAAFPFAEIGQGLRSLSLSGAAGNIAALILYAGLSLLPAIVLLCVRRKRTFLPEDALLAVISVLLFAVLYVMVNPGLIGSFFGAAELIPMGKMMMGGLIWSLLAGYMVLKMLRLFADADRTHLLRYLELFLYGYAGICIVITFGIKFSVLLDRFASLYASNRGTEDGLAVTCVFFVICYLAEILPELLTVVILESAVRLLVGIRTDSETVSCDARRLSKLCVSMLAVTVVVTIAVNLLQLVFAGLLRDIHSSFVLPILSVGTTLVILLLARYIEENKCLQEENIRLKEDNDLFI